LAEKLILQVPDESFASLDEKMEKHRFTLFEYQKNEGSVRANFTPAAVQPEIATSKKSKKDK
jgi:hypothetical protein